VCKKNGGLFEGSLSDKSKKYFFLKKNSKKIIGKTFIARPEIA